ncbi:MAG: cysteine--tRNA ligase [Ignavibacteriaceae bacterium]|nr:cysteine--tRNA ligase [Ignavibacteriaceae bacterium]
MLYIYNTLTKKKEEFIPLNPPYVKMYFCGPTVYDYFHIGNARSFIMIDIIRRYLEFQGYKVTFAMNLTDVDDKIIKKANSENIDPAIIAEKYTVAFMNDIRKLKIKPADLYPKATAHIAEIIQMIKTLEDKKFAYNIDGNVFYDVKKFNGYGRLSGKNIDDLESGARVEINEEKRNPLDFSLWKKAKEGEPYWESPWGKGRPGWHIECSAMSNKHFGETFDIHAGGSDLIFPHHENEIAQSEAASGKHFVNYWIHFGFLNINNEKMSKSLGNFFTAREILKKFSAESIRMLFVQSHYAGPLNFSDELLTSALKGLEKLTNLKDLIRENLKQKESGSIIEVDFTKYKKRFEDTMNDDFNTPQAVAVIFDFVKEMNKIISENPEAGPEFYKNVRKFLIDTAQNVLGIIDFSETDILDGKLEEELIELLIKLRQEAKRDKNYALADKIRIGLNELGIELKDSKEKTTFKKVK